MSNNLNTWLLLFIVSVVIVTILIRLRRATRHAKILYNALKKKGVHTELEYWDGHKHVDIFIKSANISIEIDGIQHFTDPDQIVSDFKRECASCRQGGYTLHIPNILIDSHLDEIAGAIAQAARKLQ